MKGLAEKTGRIFDNISKLECIQEFTLIGGTALALQINNRQSEDLDFCKWKKIKKEEPKINWPKIEKELKQIGKVSTDVRELNDVLFLVEGVKVSFYANHLNKAPRGMKRIHVKNNLYLADIDSIGYMKLEVMLRRNKFRDYYDIYSILKEGKSLVELIAGAGKYCDHRFKSKNMEAILSNGSRFSKEESFELLKPKYNVSSHQIEEYILNQIRQEKINKGIINPGI